MLERSILRFSLRTTQHQLRRRTAVTPILGKRAPSSHPNQSRPHRLLSTTTRRRIGITEDSDSTAPRKQSEPHWQPTAPTPISDEHYHEVSDQYFETMLEKLEELQEEKADMDVEYSQGVMTISYPPLGTYVVNKQPFNKQIWLSAPQSGPKRYDWVVPGEGMDEKGGTGLGEWVYLRDGSTLTQLLEKELRIKMDMRE